MLDFHRAIGVLSKFIRMNFTFKFPSTQPILFEQVFADKIKGGELRADAIRELTDARERMRIKLEEYGKMQGTYDCTSLIESIEYYIPYLMGLNNVYIKKLPIIIHPDFTWRSTLGTCCWKYVFSTDEFTIPNINFELRSVLFSLAMAYHNQAVFNWPTLETKENTIPKLCLEQIKKSVGVLNLLANISDSSWTPDHATYHHSPDMFKEFMYAFKSFEEAHLQEIVFKVSLNLTKKSGKMESPLMIKILNGVRVKLRESLEWINHIDERWRPYFNQELINFIANKIKILELSAARYKAEFLIENMYIGDGFTFLEEARKLVEGVKDGGIKAEFTRDLDNLYNITKYHLAEGKKAERELMDSLETNNMKIDGCEYVASKEEISFVNY